MIPEGTGSKRPVSGFQIRSESVAWEKPSQATTLPLESIDAWTATIGQSTGAAHAPVWAGAAAAAAGSAAATAASRAVSRRVVRVRLRVSSFEQRRQRASLPRVTTAGRTA